MEMEAMQANQEIGEKDNSDTKNDVNSLNEYETQLLGFTPVTLINGMFNSVCDLYRDAFKAFCATCLEKYPGVMTEIELNQARHAVGQEVDKDVCEVFDKLELFALMNVFTIPDECVLPEDMCQLTFDPTRSDGIEEKIREVKRKILAVKYANATLFRQLESAEAFKVTLDKVADSLKDVTSKEGNQDVNLKDVLSYFSDTVMAAYGKSKS